MIKTLISSSILALLLTGCINSEPPKCSDDNVKETLREIYAELFVNAQNNFLAAFVQTLPKNIESISSIRPVAYDESVKLRSCKANVTFENNQSAAIEYTVQQDEENSEEYYVEMNTEFLEGLMQQSIMQNILNK